MMPPTDSQAARHTGGWIVLGGLFILACLYFKMPHPSAPSLAPNATIKLGIDVNRAGEAELACIPGVGASLAKQIVSFRKTHGPFQTLSQLEQVPGVGPAKAAQLAEALLPIEEQPTRFAAVPRPQLSVELGSQLETRIDTQITTPLNQSTGTLHD